MTNSLSPEETKALSHRYMMAVDKWPRMLCGLATSLERYEEGILYLKIENTEAYSPSSAETAAGIAARMVECAKELAEAKGFVATFYRRDCTGFMAEPGASKEQYEAAVARLRRSYEQEPEFIGTFSSPIAR